MNKLHIISVAAAFCSLACVSPAQDTNALKTDIGVFEAQTGIVIIKGFGQIGSISAGTGVITVRTKESTDVSTGHKTYGLAIEIAGNNQSRERIFIDYNEIDSLLNAINYLNKITYDVTSLPSFEASYTTKAGLRVVANSVRREGGIRVFLEYGDHPRILLSSVQMTQFYGLIEQARDNLNSIRTAK
jgi:hypothetical protein